MDLPGVDAGTAGLLAGQAVRRLGELHRWIPAGHAEQTLRETLDHGGFVSQAALLAEIENLAAVDRDAFVSRSLLDGLKTSRLPSRSLSSLAWNWRVRRRSRDGGWTACSPSKTSRTS